MTDIHKILVANRGEIALRIMRSAREMGIQTVAIYSEADRLSPHVRFADEAFCVGPPPSAESYLNIQRIIDTAIACGAQAIHPGYGFLSENEHFARRVTESGLIFIGPSAHSIGLMGNKLAAKKMAADHGVPLVPGTKDPVLDTATGQRIAREIGYPILLKAAAGGGGKGMRIVEREEDFPSMMERAVSEAAAAFGDGSVFIEKYIGKPRHIEFQVLGDTHGNVVHLFERECSVQRRHQKVIEEAPSSVLTPELRSEMGDAAVRVARACGYYGAGTIEFLLDENQRFYFLEMNTRLQVEHPVTEEVTGLDLVEWQLTVADGGELPSQDSIQTKGHAIEYRVYAEDPKTFFPSPGKLEKLQWGEGARIETGYEEGNQVTPFYDPMISKIIIRGTDRIDALSKSQTFFNHVTITGVKTNILLFKEFIRSEEFISGDYATAVLPQWMEKIKEEHTL